MKLSAKQAAQRVGKSTPTITRAIKNGRLSANRNDKGGYEIDPSELFRVYPPKDDSSNAQPLTQPVKCNDMQPPTLPPENNALQKEIELLRERIEDKDSVIDDLRQRLDKESEERRKLTAMISDQRKSIWKKIIGK